MRFNKHYVLWGVFASTYILLTLIIPPQANVLTRYGISSIQAKLLGLTIAIPYVAIWFTAFYGYVHCKQYAHFIGRDKDGKAMTVLSNGLMYLALSLPITTITTTILSYFANRNSDLLPLTTIITNYVSLLVVLFAFLTISKGTKMFTRLVKLDLRISMVQLALLLGFLVFCLFYVFVTITNPARQFPTINTPRAAYYLPDFLLIATIIVPYIIIWYLGLSATYRIHTYKNQVAGVLYKKALENLAWGIAWVVIASMALRLLVSLTTIVNSLSLKLLLIVLYMLLVCISVGYLLIASGAKKMKKIEEV